MMEILVFIATVAGVVFLLLRRFWNWYFMFSKMAGTLENLEKLITEMRNAVYEKRLQEGEDGQRFS